MMLNKKAMSTLFLALLLVIGGLGTVAAASRHGSADALVDQLVDGLGTNVTICLTDNYGYVWDITVTGLVNGYYTFTGSVQTPDCGTYFVHGTYHAATNTFVLTAVNPNPPPGCVVSFSYHGIWNPATGSGSGVWTNSAGFSGTFNIFRCNQAPEQRTDSPGPAQSRR